MENMDVEKSNMFDLYLQGGFHDNVGENIFFCKSPI